MSTIETIYSSPQERSAAKGQSRIKSVLDWIEMQLERRRSRHALLEMSDEQLKDIGLSRGDAYREGHRRLWS